MIERSFGTIQYLHESWRVKAQPHVATRLRRLFPKAIRGVEGEVILSDTPENAYELEWVLQRYPMRIESGEERFRERIAQHHERQSAIERILHDVQYTPPMFQLALPPREYQRTAADMLLRTGHLLLADELGTGKTVTAICALTDKEALPALVVAPVSILRQWKAQLAKFAPGLATHILRKGTPYDLTIGYRGRREPFPDVIISSYAKLRGWADTLAGLVRTVIFDEGQELRRSGSQKYEAAVQIAHAARYRMALSGTPVYNYGAEIHTVIDVLAPDVLGSREEFIREWCYQGEKQPKIREPKALGTYLREHGLMLRRTRKDVGRELPALEKVAHHIDANLDAIKKCSANVAELARTILAQSGVKNFDRMRAASELDVMMRHATGVAKAPYVAEFVRMLVEAGEPVLLYGWHHDVYEIWLDKLKEFAPAMYTGRESPAKKAEAHRRFVQGETDILIMSLRAAAGLDGLQERCRTIVHGELDWSPGVHKQCDGRAHRDGQEHPVTAYYLIAEDGTDPIMADILQLKRSQAEGIINPTGSLFEAKSDGRHIQRLAEEVLRRHGKRRALG